MSLLYTYIETVLPQLCEEEVCKAKQNNHRKAYLHRSNT